MGTNCFFKCAAVCVLAVGAAIPAIAVAATQTGPARAITLQPLSIVKVVDLDFGNAIPGSTAGTIIISPTSGARVKTGGVTLAVGGTPVAAQFLTYGGPLQVIQITRGALPTLTRSGGGASMTVTQLTLNGATTRFLNAAGVVDLRVGGTLAVGANQSPGTYSGTFDITVTYF
jgi:hypothetical protein